MASQALSKGAADELISKKDGHIVWFLPNAYGHVKPSLHIMKLLVEQGHRIVCYGTDDYKTLIESAGVVFKYTGGLTYKDFRVTHHNPGRSPIEALQPAAVALLPLLLLRLREDRPSCIVHDHMCLWGAYAAAILGIRSVCVITSIVPEVTELEDLAQEEKLACPNVINHTTVHTLRKEYNIITSWKDALTTFSPQCNIVTTNAVLQPPFVTAFPPDTFHFCGAVTGSGPEVATIGTGVGVTQSEAARGFRTRLNQLLHRVLPDAAADDTADSGPATTTALENKLDTAAAGAGTASVSAQNVSVDKRGCSVLYVSMGTEVQVTQRFWHSFIMAFQGRQDVVLVCALGRSSELPDITLQHMGRDMDGSVRPWPANFCLYQYAPQEAVLEVADAFVTHSGMNSTVESLRAGVPMICIPHFSDQPSVANQVCEEIGAGLYLDRFDLSVHNVKETVQHVLTEPSFREVARRVGMLLRRDQTQSTSRAAKLIAEMASGAATPTPAPQVTLKCTVAQLPSSQAQLQTGALPEDGRTRDQCAHIPPLPTRYQVELQLADVHAEAGSSAAASQPAQQAVA